MIVIQTISLIALDIGGTLLSDDNTISRENVESIKLAKGMGIKIALATAREYSSTKYISKLIDCDYGIFSNGSHLLDLSNLKSLKSSLIQTQAVLEIYKYCKENNLYIHLNQEICEVSDEMKYFNLKHHLLNETYPEELKSSCYLIRNLSDYIKNNTITKIIIVSEKKLEEHINKLKQILDEYNLFITEYNRNLYEKIIDKTINYIEIGSLNDTKASGLLQLGKLLNIPPEQILVFGDRDNDIEMFTTFENSVCMANGTNKVKTLSRYITKNNNNNSGVSEGINYYITGGVKK